MNWNRAWLIGSLVALVAGPLLVLVVAELVEGRAMLWVALAMGAGLLPILSWLALSPSTKPPVGRLTRHRKRDGMLVVSCLAVVCWAMAAIRAGQPFDGSSPAGLWVNWFYLGWAVVGFVVWVGRAEPSDDAETQKVSRSGHRS